MDQIRKIVCLRDVYLRNIRHFEGNDDNNELNELDDYFWSVFGEICFDIREKLE